MACLSDANGPSCLHALTFRRLEDKRVWANVFSAPTETFPTAIGPLWILPTNMCRSQDGSARLGSRSMLEVKMLTLLLLPLLFKYRCARLSLGFKKCLSALAQCSVDITGCRGRSQCMGCFLTFPKFRFNYFFEITVIFWLSAGGVFNYLMSLWLVRSVTFASCFLLLVHWLSFYVIISLSIHHINLLRPVQ